MFLDIFRKAMYRVKARFQWKFENLVRSTLDLERTHQIESGMCPNHLSNIHVFFSGDMCDDGTIPHVFRANLCMIGSSIAYDCFCISICILKPCRIRLFWSPHPPSPYCTPSQGNSSKLRQWKGGFNRVLWPILHQCLSCKARDTYHMLRRVSPLCQLYFGQHSAKDWLPRVPPFRQVFLDGTRQSLRFRSAGEKKHSANCLALGILWFFP